MGANDPLDMASIVRGTATNVVHVSRGNIVRSVVATGFIEPASKRVELTEQG